GFALNFTEDGVMEVEGTFRVDGRAALAEMVRRTPYGVVHVTVDATVEVDGDTAVQDVKLLVLSRPASDAAPGSKSKLTNTGRYHDKLVRTPDGWRFAHRTAVLDGGFGG
ncbi:MAG TPA: nuclear transport factor 2 family protein, partial [Acidimicrobiales bacterium]|nr:nuclear transport factor 2 family protein [Acidimicrobiales bacterium]